MSSQKEPAALPLDGELAAVAARMSGLLLPRESVDSVLELVVTFAVPAMGAVAGAGVTLADESGEFTTTAASDEATRAADALQYRLGEGPCLTALTEGVTVRVTDVERERRWPRWRAEAVPFGFRSVLSAPLVTGDGCHGAIKTYAREPGAFGDAEEDVLSRFAGQVATLVANARAHERADRFSERFRATLRERDLINLAKGLLMQRDGVDEGTAFAVLLASARADGCSPAEAAADLVATPRRKGMAG
ncbi:GAF and ANTAR domain-containing protein [Amycolatopsis sp. NPDC049252]|uniref:GAF and ANTAR domain-containing protein n=1 Tax=Amycolatopsis sp. NPDC049252 TaxID=3363933 RepID=UPI0037248C87